MSEVSKAVFLSYASQDAAAAKRICEALRQAGSEVWFDRAELRGGDAWDQKIRQQIKECALFVPLISASTQARLEGYFRREWRMAVDRMHDMDDDMPFLVPVVIDDTPDATARVPERFRERQWTRLPGGEASNEFVDRVGRLLRGNGAPVSSPPSKPDAARRPAPHSGRWRRTGGLIAGAIAVAVATGVVRWRPWDRAPSAPVTAAAVSEARQLAERAHAIFDRGDLTRQDLQTAEDLCNRAIAADPMDADAWAARAQVHSWWVFYRYDSSETRKAQANSDAARARNLAPQSFQSRLAHAAVLAKVVALPPTRAEAERVLLELAQERPDDVRVLDHLGLVLRASGRNEEAGEYFLRANNPGGAAWTYTEAGEYARAMAAVDRALEKDQAVSSLTLKAVLEYRWREDLNAAQAIIDRLPGSTLLDDSYAMTAVTVAFARRDHERALDILRSLPGDYFSALGFSGPKAALMAMAHEIAGRPEAAAAEWRVALRTVDQRLERQPNDPELLWWKASALVGMGDAASAARQLELALQLAGAPADYVGDDIAGVMIRLGRGDKVLDWLEKRLTERSPGWERFHSAARFHRDYDPLRGQPRFEKLLRDHLPEGATSLSEPTTKGETSQP